MHTDEAVHADKFGTLLEEGRYKYEPHEYHGPTLNYFTLPAAWLSSAHAYTEISEITVRIVPVVFGVLLILLTLFVADGLGSGGVWAALLVAVSPALFFYSRYYIQETLLVCFTFGVIVSGYRYVCTRRLLWVIPAGVFLGLMHATKETCIIALGSMALALTVLILNEMRKGRPARGVVTAVKPVHLLIGAGVALGVSALFFSSFFRNPRGILDSYMTYATYFGRAGGEDTVHVHPWYYYLRMLLYARYGHGPVWTEGAIVLLALVGLVVALRGKAAGLVDARLLRFVALYTVSMTVVYAAIPYKTPWCLLGFLHGMILLAGVGAATLWRWARKPVARVSLALLLGVAVAHLAFQAYRGNFVYYADSRNPYVYAHPTPDVFTVADVVQEYAGLYEDPCDLTVQVACSGRDYWPLPWYLRFYRVGYSDAVPDRVGPLIFVSGDLEGALGHKLYMETPPEQRRMYLYVFDEPYYVWARPQVKLVGFVRKDLWEAYQSELVLREAVQAYLKARAEGDDPNDVEFFRRYPGLEDELRRRIDENSSAAKKR
jgi:uncharacterized protein (TIGR03663 family)